MDNLMIVGSSIGAVPGTIDYVVESSPELTFYCVAVSGEWDKGYFASRPWS